jgi:beta-lactam-binding protein with PASTA domain
MVTFVVFTNSTGVNGLMNKSFLKQFLIALAAMLVVSFLLLKSLDLISRHGQSTPVPDVSGMKADEALEKLDDEGLEGIITDSLYADGKKPGVILEQNPEAGQEVKSGRKIYLLVSTGNPPLVEIPDLRDLSLREANALLETKGLKLGKIGKKPGPGAVLEMRIRGTKIPPKAKLPKGTAVDIIIGTGAGEESVPVPDLTGLTRTEVINLLSSMGLGVGFEKFENVTDSSRAVVFKQYPEPTEEPAINTGEVVDIWYGR